MVVGLSGGIDSSYVAYLATQKYKLRVLGLHVDAGWNTEIAIHNIEKLLIIWVLTYIRLSLIGTQ